MPIGPGACSPGPEVSSWPANRVQISGGQRAHASVSGVGQTEPAGVWTQDCVQSCAHCRERAPGALGMNGGRRRAARNSRLCRRNESNSASSPGCSPVLRLPPVRKLLPRSRGRDPRSGRNRCHRPAAGARCAFLHRSLHTPDRRPPQPDPDRTPRWRLHLPDV